MFYVITVVSDVALCNLVDRYQGFRRTCAWIWKQQFPPEFWYFCIKLHSATSKQ